MTLEHRLSSALAGRGPQRLGQFLANALGLTCASHYDGSVCSFHLSDEDVVARLEAYGEAQNALRPRSKE